MNENHDDILGLLNADIADTPNVKAVGAEKLEQSPDPTHVGKKPSPGKKKRAGSYVTVHVEGDYYSRSAEARGRVIKHYKTSFNLPTLDRALSIVKSILLPQYLKKIDQCAIAPRTYNIVGAEAHGNADVETEDVRLMDVEALKNLIRHNKLPVNPDDHSGNLVSLRESVIDALCNPIDFTKRENKRVADTKLRAELERLNS